MLSTSFLGDSSSSAPDVLDVVLGSIGAFRSDGSSSSVLSGFFLNRFTYANGLCHWCQFRTKTLDGVGDFGVVLRSSDCDQTLDGNEPGDDEPGFPVRLVARETPRHVSDSAVRLRDYGFSIQRSYIESGANNAGQGRCFTHFVFSHCSGSSCAEGVSDYANSFRYVCLRVFKPSDVGVFAVFADFFAASSNDSSRPECWYPSEAIRGD